MLRKPTDYYPEPLPFASTPEAAFALVDEIAAGWAALNRPTPERAPTLHRIAESRKDTAAGRSYWDSLALTEQETLLWCARFAQARHSSA